LTSNTMLLPGVTANLTGMLVYNTTTTGGAGVNTIGIYFWNGAVWVKANLPSTSAADSGKVLMSTGSGWTVISRAMPSVNSLDTLRLLSTAIPISYTKVLDTTLHITSSFPYNYWYNIRAIGVLETDFCDVIKSVNGWGWATRNANSTIMFYRPIGGTGIDTIGTPFRVRCYRPSA